MIIGAVIGLLAATHAGADQPSARQTGKTVEATTSYRVTGVVVDDRDQPVVNAAVALIAESYTREWTILGADTRTGPDGRFVIEGIASGVYWVTAAVPSVTAAAATASNGSTVTIQNNGDMLRIETSNGTTTQYRFYYSEQREIAVAAGPVLNVRIVVKRPTP